MPQKSPYSVLFFLCNAFVVAPFHCCSSTPPYPATMISKTFSRVFESLLLARNSRSCSALVLCCCVVFNCCELRWLGGRRRKSASVSSNRSPIKSQDHNSSSISVANSDRRSSKNSKSKRSLPGLLFNGAGLGPLGVVSALVLFVVGVMLCSQLRPKKVSEHESSVLVGRLRLGKKHMLNQVKMGFSHFFREPFVCGPVYRSKTDECTMSNTMPFEPRIRTWRVALQKWLPGPLCDCSTHRRTYKRLQRRGNVCCLLLKLGIFVFTCTYKWLGQFLLWRLK